MKALRLDVAGELTEIELNRGMQLEQLYQQIGCRNVDVVAVEGFDFWIDDEGLFTQAPNLCATWLISGLRGEYWQDYHGTVVITRGPDPEGEMQGLNEAGEELVREVFGILPARIRLAARGVAAAWAAEHEREAS